MVDLPNLRRTSLTYPAIDNHAHPLLLVEHRDDVPFEGLISEAQGDAMKDAVHTLACYRATPQLAELLELPAGSSWEDVKAKRGSLDYLALCKRSFDPTGIQCILIDDGLGVRDIVHPVAWHSQLTHSPARRVVRIEVVAQDILEELFRPIRDTILLADLGKILNLFRGALKEALTAHAKDAQVVAFKSVVCYRSGLAVSVARSPQSDLAAFEEVFVKYKVQGNVRLAAKAVNDMVVRMALQIAGDFNKPVQFHTGLGDNDIDLVLSSPAHLQPIIKAFPKTTFVLLHSSYPYTREAGYLAAVYSNVYLDFGEVFPFVSGQGQRSVIRQVLELTPTTKIMWSTDGHFWPESYYLGTIQARQVLYEVLEEIVQSRELTEAEAVTIVQNALFHNANRVYNLGLEPHLP